MVKWMGAPVARAVVATGYVSFLRSQPDHPPHARKHREGAGTSPRDQTLVSASWGAGVRGQRARVHDERRQTPARCRKDTHAPLWA